MLFQGKKEVIKKGELIMNFESKNTKNIQNSNTNIEETILAFHHKLKLII